MKTLFVCTANVCRSPMATAMLNALVKDARLPFRAESAGVEALRGEGIVPNAVAALQEIGIYPGDHQARQVDGTMIERADLVLAMGPRHVAELRRLFGELPGKVHTLPGYALGASAEEEISDPYGHTMTAYRASVRQLLGYVQPLLERLSREGDVP